MNKISFIINKHYIYFNNQRLYFNIEISQIYFSIYPEIPMTSFVP